MLGHATEQERGFLLSIVIYLVSIRVCRFVKVSTSHRIKRAFNLLKGVNQGCGLLLDRDLEKREPGALVNTRRRLNALLLLLKKFLQIA